MPNPRRLFTSLLLLGGFLLLSEGDFLPSGAKQAEAGESVTTISVRPGDTLYALAQKHYTDVETLAELNNLNNPALIRVGQKLRLPAREKRAKQAEETVDQAVPAISRGESLGDFTLTAYTAGPESTGKSPGHPAYGITSSGARVAEGVTIAVDPDIIPIGSRVYIDGVGYRVAQDTGSAIKGNRIDVYLDDVNEALQFGVKRGVKVELVE